MTLPFLQLPLFHGHVQLSFLISSSFSSSFVNLFLSFKWQNFSFRTNRCSPPFPIAVKYWQNVGHVYFCVLQRKIYFWQKDLFKKLLLRNVFLKLNSQCWARARTFYCSVVVVSFSRHLTRQREGLHTPMSCSVSRNNQDLFLVPLKQRYGFLQREDRIIRKTSLNRC